jgi:hypothetical protein
MDWSTVEFAIYIWMGATLLILAAVGIRTWRRK